MLNRYGYYAIARHVSADLLVGLTGVVTFIVRTQWEDATLHAELSDTPGYAQQTRYRLLPGVW